MISRNSQKPGANPPGFCCLLSGSSRMRIPMLLLILLPFMILLLGPALLQVAQLLH